MCYNVTNTIFGEIRFKEDNVMKHVKTLNEANLALSVENGGCGECQTSCQSACKTSCTVANQKCEKKGKRGR